ncbi:MAG: helicase SNF2, partial [Chitinophagaceae bacterium]|nr:helicase SNF2 [Chitinophagaceae bacterium]
MALPHLIKYVYTNGTDEVIRRGKKIHANGFVELIEYDELLGSVTFRVKDDSYATYYKVNVQKFKDLKTLSLRCSCPYNLGDICRHESAALIQLQELLDKNMLQAEKTSYDQRHTVVKMKFIDLKTIKLLCSPESYLQADEYLRNQQAKITFAQDEIVKATVELESSTYPVVIRKNEERNFDTSCDYEDAAHPLCLPKVIVLLQLLQTHGPHYFDSIRNWDKEKNKLLEAYGYSLNDDLKGKFEFAYKEGKPFLRVLDTSIKRITPVAVNKPRPVEMEIAVQEESALPSPLRSGLRLGIVFNFNHKSYPFFQVEAVQGETDEEQKTFIGKTEKLDLSKFVNVDVLTEEDKQLLPSLRRMQESEVTKYLNRNSPFSGIWENIIHQESDELPEETRHLMIEYLHPRLKKIFTEVASNPFVFYLQGHKPFKTDSLKTLGIVPDFITPHFKVVTKKDKYEVSCWVSINGNNMEVSNNALTSGLLFFYGENIYLWNNIEDVTHVEKFIGKERVMISKADWPQQL